jgi:hypothetical protein
LRFWGSIPQWGRASNPVPGLGVHVHHLTWVLWIIFVIWIVVIAAAYVYWSVVNPNRLQTENYQLEQQRIKLIGDERSPGKVIEESALTSNTAMVVNK